MVPHLTVRPQFLYKYNGLTPILRHCIRCHVWCLIISCSFFALPIHSQQSKNPQGQLLFLFPFFNPQWMPRASICIYYSQKLRKAGSMISHRHEHTHFAWNRRVAVEQPCFIVLQRYNGPFFYFPLPYRVWLSPFLLPRSGDCEGHECMGLMCYPLLGTRHRRATLFLRVIRWNLNFTPPMLPALLQISRAPLFTLRSPQSNLAR